MQKLLASLAVASTMAFCSVAVAADGWGSSPSDKALSWERLQAVFADAGRLDKPLAGTAGDELKIVALSVDPKAVEQSGLVTLAAEIFDEVGVMSRAAVEQNAAAVAKLRARGYDLEDVLAATRTDDGSLTVFVGSRA